MDWFNTAQFVQEFYIFPILVSILLILIFFIFIFSYLIPAVRLNKKLSQLVGDLENINRDVNKDSLDDKFDGNPSLKQAWISYKQTFHDTYETVDGEAKVAYSRATVQVRCFSRNPLLSIYH